MLKGMIIIWTGLAADIPDGWAICDGENGTPNLRAKFLRGAGLPEHIGDLGGEAKHTHDFTGDGHDHEMAGGTSIQAGTGVHHVVVDNVAVGTTDEEFNLPPFYTVAYIMKLHDDPDPRTYLPWPYAAKAIIEHAHQTDILQIWLTFRFKMETDNKPPNGLWLVELDGVPEAITASAWQDQWTMLLTIDPLVGAPSEVTVEYDGPDDDLATVWNKQWEPWGPIPSIELPTPPETRIFSTGPAQQDDVNVSGIAVLFLDCSGNDITIGGFIGGKNGQVLQIARLCLSANDIKLEHNHLTANQNIFLHRGADETLTGEFGGWTLACNGSDWYDVSHAKHV